MFNKLVIVALVTAALVKLNVLAVRFVATTFVDVKFVEYNAPVVTLVENPALPFTSNKYEGAVVPIPILPALFTRILSPPTV